MTVASVDTRYGIQWWRWRGGGIRWRRQHSTVFDGVGNGLQQGDGEATMAGTTRGREGGARRTMRK